jgi:hypothetical protein
MRQASKDYQNYKLMKKNTSDSNLTLSEEDVSKEQIKVDVEDKLESDKKSMRDYKNQQDDSTNGTNKLDVTHVQQETDLVEIENKDTTDASKKEQGLLHYFYLTKLFAFLDF